MLLERKAITFHHLFSIQIWSTAISCYSFQSVSYIILVHHFVVPWIILFFCDLWCRYNDLRVRIFSKHPELFPEEVLSSLFSKKFVSSSFWNFALFTLEYVQPFFFQLLLTLLKHKHFSFLACLFCFFDIPLGPRSSAWRVKLIFSFMFVY